MQFKDIIYEVKDDYAHVTINRPKVLNAFTPVTLQELKIALDLAEKDKEVGIIVLSGAGDRAFCSGGDMNWVLLHCGFNQSPEGFPNCWCMGLFSIWEIKLCTTCW